MATETTTDANKETSTDWWDKIIDFGTIAGGIYLDYNDNKNNQEEINKLEQDYFNASQQLDQQRIKQQNETTKYALIIAGIGLVAMYFLNGDD